MTSRSRSAIRLSISGLIGATAGYLILHPASMLISGYYEHGRAHSLSFLMRAFSSQHASMALYFTVLGGILGLIIGSYLERIRTQYDSMKLNSITDELTGVHNRRFFFIRLKDEIDRAKRYDKHFSLLMIDMDHFKHYNDRLGHQKGDELLRQFASHLSGSVRASDFLARYGGDEFAVIMPETDPGMARALAERLRLKMQAANYLDRDRNHQGRFTVSIGIVACDSDTGDCDALIRDADLALYQAKRSGKNRVCVHSRPRNTKVPAAQVE